MDSKNFWNAMWRDAGLSWHTVERQRSSGCPALKPAQPSGFVHPLSTPTAGVCILQMSNKSEGSFSPRTAEIRADLGNAATDLHMMQTFDGPAPETINGES